MKKPPVSVIAVGVVFIACGVLDIWLGVSPAMSKSGHLAGDDLTVLSVGIIALLGSIYMLKGHNWARWLLAAWMAFHVALSIRQPYVLLGHAVIFGLILAGLFYPAASTYFRHRDG
ncbi:MAG TPA: hypothetical protein VGG63_01175 [Steroidobacteraceae bacterium]|jgi:hypothetical protein